MVRLRLLTCASLAILAASVAGCHRRRPPRYQEPINVGAPGDPNAPPGPPPDGPPGAPPPPPGPPPGTPPNPGAVPPPPPGTTRALAATGAARSLTRVTHEAIDEDAPSISPNGTVVLFETRVSSGNAITAQRVVGADPQSGASRTHYSPHGAKSGSPAWLPDGTYVYVSDAGGKPALVRSLAPTPNAATATIVGGDVAADIAHPSPSPDGKRIAFEATLRGRSGIAVVGIDGSRLTVVGEGHRPAWSPDGKRLVFTRTVLDFSQIFVANPDGGGAAQVTTDPSDHDDPSWAVSSKLIVFNSNKGYDRQGRSWNLFVVKPDGSGLLQLTEGNSDTGAPSWGNDGWIYFDSNQSGNYQIWRLRPVGEIEALGNRR